MAHSVVHYVQHIFFFLRLVSLKKFYRWILEMTKRAPGNGRRPAGTFENIIDLAVCSMCSSAKNGRKFEMPEPLASATGNKKKNKKQVLLAFG